jgi:hypothetical protein
MKGCSTSGLILCHNGHSERAPHGVRTVAPPSSTYAKPDRRREGKLFLICNYDELAHEFAFRNVSWCPRRETQGDVACTDMARPR